MTEIKLYERFVRPRLIKGLLDTPVVLVHGPRQCGKTTLARLVGDSEGYGYFSLESGVTPTFFECHRLMNGFSDHADRGVEKSYAISHFSIACSDKLALPNRSARSGTRPKRLNPST